MVKRPMTAIFAAVTAGILLSKINSFYPFIVMAMLFLTSFCIALYFVGRPEKRKRFVTTAHSGKAALFIILIPIIVSVAFVRGRQYDLKIEKASEEYTRLWEKGSSEVILEGTVKKISDDGEKAALKLSDCCVRYIYEKTAVKSGGAKVYISGDLYEKIGDIKHGNKVKVYGKLKIYEKATNDGQFDAFEYNARDGIFAKINAVELWITDERFSEFLMKVEKTKRHLIRTLNSLYTEKNAGVLTAMLLGDKSLMEEEESSLYKTAGISHILAVSGLHISLFCMGIYKILETVGIPKKVRTAAAFLVLIIYIYFSGMSVSAVRAGIMTSVLLLSQITRHHYDLMSSLCFAGAAILLISPNNLGNASFILSFTAVLGVCAAVRLKAEKYTGFIITLMTNPISLWFYFEMSLYGPIVNMIVLPLSSILMMCGFLSMVFGCVFLPLGGMFAGMTHILLRVNEISAKIIGSLPYSYICTGRPYVWQIALYYGLLILGYAILRKKQTSEEDGQSSEEKTNIKSLFSAIVFPIMAVMLLFIPKINKSLAFLDVGQGDSIVLLNGKECIITDTGSSDRGAVGKYILTQYLKYHGVVEIDKAVVTHGDDDHINGIIQILEDMNGKGNDESKRKHYNGRISVGTLILPKTAVKNTGLRKLEELAAEKNVAIEYVELGHSFFTNDHSCKYTCLAPQNAKKSENGTSLVYLLETPGLTVYLTGDADVKEEKAYLLNAGKFRRDGVLTVLKAGHHGSRTSDSTEFLEAINPDVAVISCGHNNRYGHPHKEVIDNLQDMYVEIRRTDQEGQIFFSID